MAHTQIRPYSIPIRLNSDNVHANYVLAINRMFKADTFVYLICTKAGAGGDSAIVSDSDRFVTETKGGNWALYTIYMYMGIIHIR